MYRPGGADSLRIIARFPGNHRPRSPSDNSLCSAPAGRDGCEGRSAPLPSPEIYRSSRRITSADPSPRANHGEQLDAVPHRPVPGVARPPIVDLVGHHVLEGQPAAVGLVQEGHALGDREG